MYWGSDGVSCLLKQRGERMRQQSSEGDDDGEGVFAGEEEKKRWSAPMSIRERGMK